MHVVNLAPTVTRIAAAALIAAGLAFGLGTAVHADAALPTPQQVTVQVVNGSSTAVSFQWVDQVHGEEGYELLAHTTNTGGAVTYVSTMVPGEITGVGSTGHGVMPGLKPSTNYCFSVRAYRLIQFAQYSNLSTPRCFTMPAAPAAPAPAPASTTAPAATWPTLRQGASGEAVFTLQYFLRQHGSDTQADGDFGPQTMAAVQEYQRSEGLRADGVVGPQTWESLMVVLQYGSQGEAVEALQHQLAARGQAVAVDGDFGQQTRDAVHAYQISRGFVMDGVVGPRTWQALIGGR